MANNLISLFTKRPVIPESQELKYLGSNLTTEIVETVLKGFKSWRVSEKFFKWTSNQGGFRHNCYTYNAMASTCSAKCFTEGFSYRYGEFKRPTKKRRRKKPGSLSFSFFSVFLLPQPPPLPLSPHKPNHHQSYHNRQLRLEHFSRISASLSTRLLIIMVSKGEGIEKDTTSIDTLRALLHWKQLLTKLHIKNKLELLIMTRKRARGTTMLDKLQPITRSGAAQSNLETISESSIEVEPEYRSLHIQRRPPTRAHPNLNEEFVQPQLTGIRSNTIRSGNQTLSGISSSVQVGLQSIGGTSNPLSEGRSHVLGSRSYLSKVGSINVDDASNSLLGNTATNSLKLIGSASFKVLDSQTISSQGLQTIHPQSANNISDPTEIDSQPIDSGSNANPSKINHKKKGRGPAKGPKPTPENKLVVEFNEVMQPIGENAVSFQTYLGTIARNGVRFPLTFPSWRDMPHENLEDVWSDIQACTTAPHAYKTNCFKSLDEKWRGWKHRLKKYHFKICKTKEEALAYVPFEVEPEQWKILVEYWSSEDVKAVAKKNAKNRDCHGPAHRTGRTPFSILREEMKKQGLKTDELSVYIKTRTDKSGATKDDEASRLIASMEEKLSSIPESERTEEVRQSIFKEAMGEECHGYSRTMGLGPTPSQLAAKSCMSYQPSDELMAKIWSQVEDFYVQKFSGIIEGLQTQINNINTQLESMRSVKDGSPAIACTKCVHQVLDASNAPQLDTNLQKNSASHELHEYPMDEGI